MPTFPSLVWLQRGVTCFVRLVKKSNLYCDIPTASGNTPPHIAIFFNHKNIRKKKREGKKKNSS